MAIAYSTRTVTDGLILYLDAANTKSYPGTGTTWSDLSGNSNHGVLTNGPVFSSLNGGSFQFDGTNDYVEIPYNSSTISFPTNNATICVWFKTSAIGDGAGALVAQRNTSGSGFQTYVLSNKLYADGGGAGATYGSTTLQREVIYFGVVVYDKVNSLIRLFLNGSPDGQNTYPGNIQDTFPIRIASSAWGDGPYPGNIYTAQVYNRVLSLSEIKQNFNATRSRYGV